jgi:tetratricopeptide (TPR) repeat protein
LELKDYPGMKEAWDAALSISQVHKKEISGQMLFIWGKKFNEGVDAINNSDEKPELIDKAIEAFNMSVQLMPDSISTQRNLGLAYLKKGEIENAAVHFTLAFEKGKDLLALRRLGRVYQDSAVALYLKFEDINKDAIDLKRKVDGIREGMKGDDVKFVLGEPSKINKPAKPKKGDTKEEWNYDQFNMVLSLDGGIVKMLKFTKPYEAKIDSSDKKQSVALYNKAIDVYKRGQVIFPEDPDISESLMNAYIGADRTVEARALLDERVRKYPNSKFDHYNLGVFLLKDAKYEDAIGQFAAALKLDTTFSAALYNLAACYVNWGVAEQERLKPINEKLRADNKPEDQSYKEKYRLAVPWLERVLRNKADDVQMWELLGQVYANLNDQAKAMEAYKKADEIRASRK